MKHTIFILPILLLGCEEETQEQRDFRLWNENCRDDATLVATTAGSPNSTVCTNKHHKMRVEIKTTASNEEIGAMVFCECVRPEPSPASSK